MSRRAREAIRRWIRRALRGHTPATLMGKVPPGAMPTPMSDGPRARCGPIGCGRPGCAVNHAAKLPADPFTVDL